MYKFGYIGYKLLLRLYRLKIVKKTSLAIVNILSCLVPLNDKRILFGSMNGRFYGDNSKYVYEWLLENRPDLAPVWMTASREVFSTLKERGLPVAYTFSLKGLFYVLSAPLALFTNSLRDISIDPFSIPDRMMLISLRHGRSPKRVRFARLGHKITRLEELERNRESKLVQYVISTSEFISDIQEECLRVGREKHIVTGYPRNDKLFDPEARDRIYFKDFTSDIDYRHVILYAPTWRHGRDPVEFFPFKDFEVKRLIGFLEENKILLLMRPHAGDLQYKNLNNFLNYLDLSSAYIKISRHDLFPDVNALLPFVNALICDYSALYHDYLLLNRPIIFVPYDFDDFSSDNGFLYDYFKYLPGPVVTSLNCFISELKSVATGKDEYSDKRDILKNMVHGYSDDQSTLRVVKVLDKIRGSKSVKT
ncbi:MAG: CDP-glycerol glycerophosphotransferase family protein [Marinospirillum sp.]|uniref:CDP-glycerol glycerophosphotransferase family protein n=1 Tax=Marinospirillum sp. TaxID=2183934 RepID=UPI001A08DFCA|nr:CDP-glycerol glycerophosphotransferase family protein [Marinospirillum sp.]MBE0505980.1 CDP-glycerol glycerophosphotransferase family protein [Marinospirillum sp.]